MRQPIDQLFFIGSATHPYQLFAAEEPKRVHFVDQPTGIRLDIRCIQPDQSKAIA